MGNVQTWRVVLDTGEVHEVTVRETEAGIVVRRADWFGHNVVEHSMAWARVGVTRLCSRNSWPVCEILAPGERSRKELAQGGGGPACGGETLTPWPGTFVKGSDRG